jgi:hypothetical protein
MNEFLKELADLLEEHNAELLSCDMEPIAITIGGDYMTVTTIPSAATPSEVRAAYLPNATAQTPPDDGTKKL